MGSIVLRGECNVVETLRTRRINGLWWKSRIGGFVEIVKKKKKSHSPFTTSFDKVRVYPWSTKCHKCHRNRGIRKKSSTIQVYLHEARDRKETGKAVYAIYFSTFYFLKCRHVVEGFIFIGNYKRVRKLRYAMHISKSRCVIMIKLYCRRYRSCIAIHCVFNPYIIMDVFCMGDRSIEV